MAALAINGALVGGKVVAGVVAGSLALLSDAGHDLTDVAALGLALWAVRAGRREPTGSRSFGWHRGSVLAAQANAATLVLIAAFIVAEGVDRLLHPSPVAGGLVLAVALVAAVANGGAALVTAQVGDSLTRRSVLLHLAGDALTSLAVAASGLIALLTGARWVDPAVSLLVAAVIGVAAWRLLRHTTEVLLEATPRDVDPDQVSATIADVPGVESAHDLHVWSLSADVYALSVHVAVRGHPSLEDASVVAAAVKAAVAGPFRIAHATVELECDNCIDGPDRCAVSPTALEAAARRATHAH